ncbi:hypothetical protein [Streptomyces mirabilis]|jgi:hypothetical protein|uniref:SH3 domain-containing protein n=1 Tax=Streptomyces mirabilis TaxID=68239 RepID=A0A1I2IY03_9ACTN|nr:MULTISPECIES: hypothetical protein [Streptomyces]QIY73244.1 hypothetical protein HEP84_33010 [Streptomyces sp. RLB1-33]SFF47305.1 hypothetical protein SAMN02787118_107101 [Streptomyces mirabilis]
MRKLLAGAATAMVAVAGLTFAAPAQAAPSDTVSVQDINCHAKESVRIRQSKSTGSTALGLFPKGAGADCGGASEGGTYTACGHTDGYFWIAINYQGVKGYIALYCITRP